MLDELRKPGVWTAYVGDTASRVGRRLHNVRALRYVSVARATALAVLAIGGLSLLGTAYEITHARFLAPFNLDEERNTPAFFSASLFFIAAAALGDVRRAFRRPRVPIVFAMLLVFMSVDELASIHEGVEGWLNVDWQRLYAPLFIVIAVTWCLLLADLWKNPPARWLFIASGSAWVVSQTLEYFQWDGYTDVAHYTEMMVAEETLEMVGTALLILALLHADTDPFRRSHAPHDRVIQQSADT